MFDIETKFGDIHFSQSIINRIVEKAIEDCDGKVILNNYRGGLNSATVEYIENEEGFEIKIYVVIMFGASIKEKTSGIIDSVYDNTKKMVGKKPQKVTVIVTGMASKNIAKRHIEVSR